MTFQIPAEALKWIREYSPPIPKSEIWKYLDGLDSLANVSAVDTLELFHPRLNILYNEHFFQLVDIAINVGLMAREADRSFCATMEASEGHAHPTALVYHGDSSLMKLTDRFYFKNNQEYYQHVKMDHYDDFKKDRYLDALLQKANIPAKRLLKLAGPSGVGKSFYLQYILRHIRNFDHLRALYIANPDMIFKSEIHYRALFVELAYSLAQDLQSDMELMETFRKNSKLMCENSTTQCLVFKETLQFAVKHLKKSGIKVVILLDQENVLDRLAESSSSEKRDFAQYLQGDIHGAYILSSFSYTSEYFKAGNNRSQLIRLLSDREILAVLVSRCSPLERFYLQHPTVIQEERIRSTIDTVVSTVGRCPMDIHEMMNIGARDEDDIFGTPIRAYCSEFVPDTAAIRIRHQKFFDSLKNDEKKAFLLLLSIAGRCPHIGSAGFYMYMSLHSEKNRRALKLSEKYLMEDVNDLFSIFPSDSTNNVSARLEENIRHQPSSLSPEKARQPPEAEPCAGLPADCEANHESSIKANVASEDNPADIEQMYFTIDIFTRVEGLESFALRSRASQVLDGRYFFIDDHGYVRPCSEPAFRAIKAYHQEQDETINSTRMLLNKVKRAAPGVVFESSFFLNFKVNQLGGLERKSTLEFKNASNFLKKSISLSINIDDLFIQTLNIDRIFLEGRTTLYQCPPNFPVADFFIVSPHHAPEDCSHFELSLLPDMTWIVPSLKIQEPGRPGATLIIGQLTINGEIHGKVDKDVCKGFTKSDTKSNAEYGKMWIEHLIRSFLNICQLENLNPCILFVWIAEHTGPVSHYHPKSIVSTNYSVYASPDHENSTKIVYRARPPALSASPLPLRVTPASHNAPSSVPKKRSLRKKPTMDIDSPSSSAAEISKAKKAKNPRTCN